MGFFFFKNFVYIQNGFHQSEYYKYVQANHKRFLNIENKLRLDEGAGERGKWEMGIEEGTCWDEHWVLGVRDDSWESTPEAKSTLYSLYVS